MLSPHEYENQEEAEFQEQVMSREVLNVLDAFGGVGGNLIQFGLKCGFCVGVDNDKVKIKCMKNNAQIYGL